MLLVIRYRTARRIHELRWGECTQEKSGEWKGNSGRKQQRNPSGGAGEGGNPVEQKERSLALTGHWNLPKRPKKDKLGGGRAFRCLKQKRKSGKDRDVKGERKMASNSSLGEKGTTRTEEKRPGGA